MASKKNDKGEPVGWVTVKGKHFPKWADGTIGWQDGQEDIEVNNKKVTVKGNENHAQAIYRQAQEEMGESVDTKFYNSLGDARIVDEPEKPKRQSAKSTDGKEEWKKGQNYTGSYTKKEEAMSDKEYEKSVYDKLRKNGWSEKMAKAEAAEQVKVRNDDLGGVRPTKKQASMELGNGLRLTSDISDPYKNYSEVERAKKVNREKQYADKKLNQYRKAAAEEKAKAQSIADAISAKTGIANTGSSSNNTVSERERKVAEQARKSLTFDKGYAEITANHWNYAKMSNDKVVKALNATDNKYSYELRQEQTKGAFMSPNVEVNHTRIYRTEKKPATTSRNAKYDTSRSKKVPSYSTFEKQFLKESGEDVWNMSLQRYNLLKKQAREIYEKQYGKKK